MTNEDLIEFCKEKNIPLYSFDDLIEFMDGTGDKIKPWPTLNSMIEWSLENESLSKLCISTGIPEKNDFKFIMNSPGTKYWEK